MFVEIAFYRLFGHPLIMYGGLLAFLCLASAAVVGKYGAKMQLKDHYKLHMILAGTGLVISFLHLFIGVAAAW